MMKPTTALVAIRPATSIAAGPSIRPLFLNRCYATQTGLGASKPQGPRRRGVTPFNDDGHVPWGELSSGEKAARATQQTYNFGMIIVGLVLTVRNPPGPWFWLRLC